MFHVEHLPSFRGPQQIRVQGGYENLCGAGPQNLLKLGEVNPVQVSTGLVDQQDDRMTEGLCHFLDLCHGQCSSYQLLLAPGYRILARRDFSSIRRSARCGPTWLLPMS